MDGTIVGEQYFNTEWNPVKSSLGQYGEFYQRNEQGYISQITYDNGIKLIDCYGEKMPEEILLLVEDYIDGNLHVFDKDWPELPFAHQEHIGCTVDYVSGRNRYMGYLISLGIYSFKVVKVGLDCANGSSWNIAKSVFDALGADTYVINAPSSSTSRPSRMAVRFSAAK